MNLPSWIGEVRHNSSIKETTTRITGATASPRDRNPNRELEGAKLLVITQQKLRLYIKLDIVRRWEIPGEFEERTMIFMCISSKFLFANHLR